MRTAGSGASTSSRRLPRSPGRSPTTRSRSLPQGTPSGWVFSGSRSRDDARVDELRADGREPRQDRRGQGGTDPPEADAAVAQVEDGVAAGPERTSHQLIHRVADGDIVPADRAREDVAPHERLVDVDADP